MVQYLMETAAGRLKVQNSSEPLRLCKARREDAKARSKNAHGRKTKTHKLRSRLSPALTIQYYTGPYRACQARASHADTDGVIPAGDEGSRIADLCGRCSFRLHPTQGFALRQPRASVVRGRGGSRTTPIKAQPVARSRGRQAVPLQIGGVGLAYPRVATESCTPSLLDKPSLL
jgi:hypothetical protein